MRNLKVTRQLRGQTAPGLRRRLRKAEARIKELEQDNSTLAGENAHLRRRPPQKLPIPEHFSDNLIDRLCDHLARGLARKTAADVPELEQAAHACVRHMHDFLRGKLSMGISSYADIAYEVAETFRENEVRFSLCLHGVNVHYADDLQRIEMMHPHSTPKAVKAPRRVSVTDRDLAGAG